DAAASEPAGAAGRMTPFYTAVAVDDPYLIDDPTTGVRLARQEFQAVATFTDADGVPLEPVAVGEPANWFSFHDPGQAWYPSALWTVSMFLLFVLSLVWLDRLEMREKRARTDEVTEAEDLAVPIAQ
ncbi:MAG: hypothetical protein WD575_02365, partial [Nitriliruptoraceae bacterium]